MLQLTTMVEAAFNFQHKAGKINRHSKTKNKQDRALNISHEIIGKLEEINKKNMKANPQGKGPLTKPKPFGEIDYSKVEKIGTSKNPATLQNIKQLTQDWM